MDIATWPNFPLPATVFQYLGIAELPAVPDPTGSQADGVIEPITDPARPAVVPIHPGAARTPTSPHTCVGTGIAFGSRWNGTGWCRPIRLQTPLSRRGVITVPGWVGQDDQGAAMTQCASRRKKASQIGRFWRLLRPLTETPG